MTDMVDARRESVLSDELVEQLVAAGQVDLLVGLPSFNHAATIGGVAQQVHVAFARFFPRERTLLLNVDGGSTDGTVDVVRSAAPIAAESIVTSQALRTIHRISVPYHGVHGKAPAIRMLLTAADLLQARAVVMLDAAAQSTEASALARLAQPVLRGGADYVTPVYARHPLEGPLVTQLVRPLVRSLYGWRLREPLATEFAASPRLVRHLLGRAIWQETGAVAGVDLRIALEAMAGDFAMVEVPLGVRSLDLTRPRPPLAEAFGQIGETLFAGVETHAAAIRARSGSQPIRREGGDGATPPDPVTLPLEPLVDAFCRGVRDLDPIISEALPGPLFEELRAIAARPGVPELTDPLWAQTVYEFLEADRRRALPRAHVAQAIVPFYLGRAATFLTRHAASPAAEIESALEDLALEFERRKHEVAEHWPSDGRR